MNSSNRTLTLQIIYTILLDLLPDHNVIMPITWVTCNQPQIRSEGEYLSWSDLLISLNKPAYLLNTYFGLDSYWLAGNWGIQSTSTSMPTEESKSSHPTSTQTDIGFPKKKQTHNSLKTPLYIFTGKVSLFH